MSLTALSGNIRLLALLTLVLCACGDQPPTESEEQSPKPIQTEERIEYNGTYTGIVPCADCEGIETILTLKKDRSYILWLQYKGKSDLSYAYTGKYSWDPVNHIATLHDIKDSPSKYLAKPEVLVQLDMDGNEITGQLADRYVLRKSFESKLGEIRWNLIELFGKSLERSAAHIRFDVDGKQINGFAWCNAFHGGYELLDNQQIRFDDMVPTRRVCPDTTAEQQFLNMFAAASSYKLEGKILSFNRGGSVPLAKFQALESGLNY